MPLVKRTVEPIYIGRAPLDKQVKNELEGVVVNSLAGVIKQLSSISKHAENLFGDLINEASAIFERSTALNKRVEVLYQKTSRLDSASKEEVKVEDFSIQNHFKSSRQEDQQLLDRQTLPLSLQEVYSRCEKPPNLNQFTPYREDQKDGLKFYTDPNYFYDLWVQSQQKLIEKKKKRNKKHRKKKANRTKEVKEVNKRQYHGVDKEFIEQPGRAAPPPPKSQPIQAQPEKQGYDPSPAPSPSPQMRHPQHTPPTEPSFAQENRPGVAPPPPPPPGPSTAQLMAPVAPPPPPPSMDMGGGVAGFPPPPPPPPPGQDMGMPAGLAPPPPPPPPGSEMMSNSPQLQHYPMAPPPVATPAYPAPAPPPPPNIPGAPPPPMVANAPPPPPPGQQIAPPVAAPVVEDSRSALLAAIEMGKKLRKVEKNDAVKQVQYGSDVASILSRRIHIEVSDTDSDSEGSDSTDGDWDD